MITWLSQNWINILVLAIVALCVVLAIVKIVKDRKAGIMSCGHRCEECHGGCSSCAECQYEAQHKNVKGN